jgi:hypothetical protein
MSTPDSFLIAWWFLTIIFVVSGFLIARRQRVVFQQAAVTAALRHDWRGLHGILYGTQPPTATAAVSRMIGFIVLAVILIWLAGFIVLIWMGHRTTLLLLNFQLFMVLFGAACVGVGLSSRMSAMAFSRPSLLPRSLMRPLIILFGLFAFALGAKWIVGDVAFPRLIVEGQVDRISHLGVKWDEYSIVIDGSAYNTLRDVYLAVNTGERVRAEIGAGSKTVLRAERISSKAQ